MTSQFANLIQEQSPMIDELGLMLMMS